MNSLLRMFLPACAALVLAAACGSHETAQAPASLPPPPSVAAQTPPPPPPPAEEPVKDQLTALGAIQADRGWVVTLHSAQYKAGQTSFEPSDTTRIDALANLMKKRPDLRIQVQSFTDSRGSTAHNHQLSQQRAEAVQQALVERGVPASRISAEGRGEIHPVASNNTAAGREKNRRVEVVVSDAQGHFASAAPLNSKD